MYPLTFLVDLISKSSSYFALSLHLFLRPTLMTIPSLPQALQRPEYWIYISEGGKNLVLRYTGPSLDRDPFVEVQDQEDEAPSPPSHSAAPSEEKNSSQPLNGSEEANNTSFAKERIALRISKKDKPNPSSTSSSQLDTSSSQSLPSASSLTSTSSDLFREKVISPLLSPATLNHPIASSLIPKTERRKVSSSFLSELAEHIESSRPEKRRKDSEIDIEQDEVWLVEDLTSGSGKKTLAVEIKVSLNLLWNNQSLFWSHHIDPDLSLTSKSLITAAEMGLSAFACHCWTSWTVHSFTEIYYISLYNASHLQGCRKGEEVLFGSSRDRTEHIQDQPGDTVENLRSFGSL